MDTQRKVLIITIVHPLVLMEKTNRNITLGLRIDEQLNRLVRFLEDPSIPHVEVHQSCEHTPLPEEAYAEHVAPAVVFSREQKNVGNNMRSGTSLRPISLVRDPGLDHSGK